MKRTGLKVPAAALGLAAESQPASEAAGSTGVAAEEELDDFEAQIAGLEGLGDEDDDGGLPAALLLEGAEQQVDVAYPVPPAPLGAPSSTFGDDLAANERDNSEGGEGPSTSDAAPPAATDEPPAPAQEVPPASTFEVPPAPAEAAAPAAPAVPAPVPSAAAPPAAAPAIAMKKRQLLTVPSKAIGASKAPAPAAQAVAAPVKTAKAKAPAPAAPGVPSFVKLPGGMKVATASLHDRVADVKVKNAIGLKVVTPGEASGSAPPAVKKAPKPPPAATATATAGKAAPGASKPGKGVKAAAALAAGKATDKEDKPARKPTVKSALAFFQDSRRAKLKGEEPELSPEDMKTRLAHDFEQLGAADKKVFQDKQAASEAKLREWVAAQPEGGAKVKKTGAKVKEEGAVPRTKSAYMLFTDDRRAGIKADDPTLTFGEVGKALGEAWKAASAEEKAPFEQKAQELKAAAQGAEGDVPAAKKAKSQHKAGDVKKKEKKQKARLAADDDEGGAAGADGDEAASDCEGETIAAGDVAQTAGQMDMMDTDGGGEEDEEAPMQAPAKARGKKRVRGTGKRGRGGKAKAVTKAEAAPAAESSDDEEVDWDAHPAEMIVAQLGGLHDGKYLVLRRGLDFSKCGRVLQRDAKRQRLTDGGDDGDDGAAPCPVSLDMVDEFENFSRSFFSAVRERADGGELDLDDLEPGSKLEMCAYLGELLQPGGMLLGDSLPHVAGGKGMEKKMKVTVHPMLLSMAVQRIVTAAVEAAASGWGAERAALAAQIEALGGTVTQAADGALGQVDGKW